MAPAYAMCAVGRCEGRDAVRMSLKGIDAWSLPPVDRIGPDQAAAVSKAMPAC